MMTNLTVLCCSCWNAVLNVTRALIAYMPLSLVCLGVLHTLYRCMFGNFANNMKGYICYKKFEVWKASQPLVCDEASRAFCIHPLYPCYSLHTPVVGAHAGAVLDVYFNCDSPVYCHILLIITLCQVPSCKASTFAHFAKYSTGIYIYTHIYIMTYKVWCAVKRNNDILYNSGDLHLFKDPPLELVSWFRCFRNLLLPP